MNVPIVKLTIEGMRQEIQMALTQYISRMESDFSQAIKDAVESFDLEAEIRRELPRLLQHELHRAVEGLRYNKEVGRALQKALLQGLKESDDANAE